MLNWTPHPILAIPSDDDLSLMEPAELVSLYNSREEAIKNAEADPFRYGFKLDHWVKAWEQLKEVDEVLCLGGNRSSKTQFGAYSVVRAAIENPASIIMCFAQSAEVSVRQQQSAVHNWLPPEYRLKQTSSNAYISYSLKNGFTDNSLILPNKSQILFKTYSQYQNNPTFIEGAELGSMRPNWHNIGVWLDEYLLGEDLISTMRFRLATRNSKMLVTFTPIDGWTEVIKDYLDKAKTIATKEAELLGGELLPHIQRSKKRNASIHYFHTKDNPFGGYERLASDLRGESREKILIRAYGVPVKSQATKFPKFNKEVNVIPQDLVPTKDITRYHIIDPAGSKNWFMAWIAVDASGTFYCYREWPDVGIGDWAEWKGGKWQPGEGAKGLGYGIKDYVNLIAELEGDEEIYERIIDPRLGAAKYQAQDGSSSIIEDLAQNDIICIPAPGLDIEDGLQALISKMGWDTSKPMDSMNRPKFYVTDECQNIITGLSEYTGEQGLKECWKDCYDDQTEVLTDRGWVLFKDFNDTDVAGTRSSDGYLEWQKPTDKIARHYDGEMILMEHSRLSFCVTPTHRMLVYPQKSQLAWREAKDLFRQDTIPARTLGLRDSGKTGREDWFEFLGWYLGDGSIAGNMGGKICCPGRGYAVMISQSRSANAEKCAHLEKLFDRLGYKWAYRGYSYHISSQMLHGDLSELGNCYTKKIPNYAYSASRSEVEALLYGLRQSDGWMSKDGMMHYASVSRHLADGVQALMQIAGMATGSIYHKKIEGKMNILGNECNVVDQFWVGQRKTNRYSITNNKKEFLPKRVQYDGMVYCLTVPNGSLIVRRSGQVMVCGNCIDVLRYAAIMGIDHVGTGGMQVTRTGTGGY